MEQSFDLIASCIDKSIVKKKSGQQTTLQERSKEFLEQMNSNQFKQIESFFETMPKLSHTVKFKNPKTKKENEIVLEGLSSFFA